MTKRITILGAGISGISAGYHLKEAGVDSIIYEKNSSWGGLCDNFEVDGFRFDKFIHLSFTKDRYVRDLFEIGVQYLVYTPNPFNYYKGHWLKHPVQNNLYYLNVEDKIKIIVDFINRVDTSPEDIDNFEDWLRVQYGNYFAEKFPLIYTKKYWTVEAGELETRWIGSRMYRPTIEEVLEGAMTDDTPNTYYVKEMRYPKKGGYKSFLSGMAFHCNIQLNSEITKINLKTKEIEINGERREKYDTLISSLPLPELIRLVENVPHNVREASKKLKWTSGAIISLGFNKPDIPKGLWFYVYDKEILTSRIFSPSEKSRDNVPEGCSSIQGEIYFSDREPLKKNMMSILEDEIDNFIKIGLFNREDIVVKDIRMEKYANVIFNHDIYENRRIVRDYLEMQGVITIGRFGEWDYFWSDQSLLSGKDCARRISKIFSS